MVDVNENLTPLSDPVGLRAALQALVSNEMIRLSDGSSLDGEQRRKALTIICSKLSDDEAAMPSDVCDALHLEPGMTYAAGAAAALSLAQTGAVAGG